AVAEDPLRGVSVSGHFGVMSARFTHDLIGPSALEKLQVAGEAAFVQLVVREEVGLFGVAHEECVTDRKLLVKRTSRAFHRANDVKVGQAPWRPGSFAPFDGPNGRTRGTSRPGSPRRIHHRLRSIEEAAPTG